jgi:protein NRD1
MHRSTKQQNADHSAAINGFATQQGTAPVNGHVPQAQNYPAQQVVPPPTNTGATPYYGAPASIPQAAPPPPVPSVSLQNGAPSLPQPGMMQYQQPVNPAPPIQYQSNTQAPLQASEQNIPAAQPAPPATSNNDPQQQLQLLQQLAQILPPEQLAAVIAQMGFQLPAPAAAPISQVAPQVVAQPPQNGGYDAGQNSYDQGRSNQDNQPRFRDRSRSPDAKRRRVTPPNRRDSPTYGVYDPNVAQTESGRRGDSERRGDRGRGNRGNRNEFRRRTPPKDRPASPGMVQRPMQHKPPGAPKPVGHDYQIPTGRIKGILFVLLLVVHN